MCSYQKTSLFAFVNVHKKRIRINRRPQETWNLFLAVPRYNINIIKIYSLPFAGVLAPVFAGRIKRGKKKKRLVQS